MDILFRIIVTAGALLILCVQFWPDRGRRVEKARRKRTEKARKYQTLLAAMPDVVWPQEVYDATFNF